MYHLSVGSRGFRCNSLKIKQLFQFKLISFLPQKVKCSRSGDSVKSFVCIILFVPSQPLLSRELICVPVLSGHLTLSSCHGFNFAFSLVQIKMLLSPPD